MAKKMALESLLSRMEPKYKPIGTKLTLKVQERYSTITAITLRETIICLKSKEKGFTGGRIVSTRETLKKI